jgi:hypothetical protein
MLDSHLHGLNIISCHPKPRCSSECSRLPHSLPYWLFPPSPQVRALTDCHLLALSRADFNILLGSLIPKMAQEAEAYLTAAWRGACHVSGAACADWLAASVCQGLSWAGMALMET